MILLPPVVEPRGTGMALFTLRVAGEVRVPQFGSTEGDLDAEMVAIAGAIIRQRTGNFDPSTMTWRGRRQTGVKRKRRCRRPAAGRIETGAVADPRKSLQRPHHR